jgi:hypothetical protein
VQRHILLVGLPGAGKSTVGTLAAEALPAPLLDIDGILTRQMGMPVAQIFGMVGEPRFRAMERDAVATAQAREPAVIIPGAGWAAQPGQMEVAGRAASLSISSAPPPPPPSVASRGRFGPCWWAPTRSIGSGASWRPGNRSTSSLIMKSRRM